jgi:hypothetical protein
MEDTNKKTKKILSILLVIFIVFALGFLAWSSRVTIKKFFGFATVYDSVAGAAFTAGLVTDSGSYAWGEAVGWIDFSSSENNPVVVADNALWGYAYGENIGWISLNCHNGQMSSTTCTYDYKVTNDGSGKLSGYAYGENVGWIHFGTTASDRPYGVNITDGDFFGFAYGENIGWVSFNALSSSSSIPYKVSTNWIPKECSNGLDDDGDGKIDLEDSGCQNGGIVEKTTTGGIPVKSHVIEILNLSSGTQWITGSTYTIKWSLPEATTTDTFVYMTGGGYEENRVVAMASSTDLSMEYYVTDEDLPKTEGVSWKVAVCTGEIVGSNTDNCGFSGDLYVNSSGKAVAPVDSVVGDETPASSTTNTTSGKGEDKPVELAPIETVTLPVIRVEPLAPLKELPKFGGEDKDSFTFVPQIRAFILSPFPDAFERSLNKFPKLKSFLSSIGFNKEQDIIRVNVEPLLLPTNMESVPEGLFIVTNGERNIRTYLAGDQDHKVAQLTRVASGTPISISLLTDKDVVGEWDGQKISFDTKDGKAVIQFVSGTPGRYVLTTPESPLPLAVEVFEISKPSEQPNTGSGPGNWFTRLFGR